MAERGWGRVVNIASIAARSPSPGQPVHAASKAGLIAFTYLRSPAADFRTATAIPCDGGFLGAPVFGLNS